MKRAAQELADADQIPFDPKMFDSAEPSVMGMDYLQRAMATEIKGRLRTASSAARPMIIIRKRMSKELESVAPDLVAARNVWSGGEQYKDLMEEGAKAMTGKRSEILRRIDQLNNIDRQAYGQGFIQQLDDKLAATNLTSDASRSLKSKRFQDTVEALFGKERASEIAKRIKASTIQQGTYNKVRGQSDTAARTAARVDSGTRSEALGAGFDALTGNAPGILRRGAEMVTRRNPLNTEASRDLLGEMLLKSTPQERDAVIRQLTAKPPPIMTRGGGLLMPAALGVGSGLLSNQR